MELIKEILAENASDLSKCMITSHIIPVNVLDLSKHTHSEIATLASRLNASTSSISTTIGGHIHMICQQLGEWYSDAYNARLNDPFYDGSSHIGYYSTLRDKLKLFIANKNDIENVVKIIGGYCPLVLSMIVEDSTLPAKSHQFNKTTLADRTDLHAIYGAFLSSGGKVSDDFMKRLQLQIVIFTIGLIRKSLDNSYSVLGKENTITRNVSFGIRVYDLIVDNVKTYLRQANYDLNNLPDNSMMALNTHMISYYRNLVYGIRIPPDVGINKSRVCEVGGHETLSKLISLLKVPGSGTGKSAVYNSADTVTLTHLQTATIFPKLKAIMDTMSALFPHIDAAIPPVPMVTEQTGDGVNGNDTNGAVAGAGAANSGDAGVTGSEVTVPPPGGESAALTAIRNQQRKGIIKNKFDPMKRHVTPDELTLPNDVIARIGLSEAFPTATVLERDGVSSLYSLIRDIVKEFTAVRPVTEGWSPSNKMVNETDVQQIATRIISNATITDINGAVNATLLYIYGMKDGVKSKREVEDRIIEEQKPIVAKYIQEGKSIAYSTLIRDIYHNGTFICGDANVIVKAMVDGRNIANTPMIPDRTFKAVYIDGACSLEVKQKRLMANETFNLIFVDLPMSATPASMNEYASKGDDIHTTDNISPSKIDDSDIDINDVKILDDYVKKVLNEHNDCGVHYHKSASGETQYDRTFYTAKGNSI